MATSAPLVTTPSHFCIFGIIAPADPARRLNEAVCALASVHFDTSNQAAHVRLTANDFYLEPSRAQNFTHSDPIRNLLLQTDDPHHNAEMLVMCGSFWREEGSMSHADTHEFLAQVREVRVTVNYPGDPTTLSQETKTAIRNLSYKIIGLCRQIFPTMDLARSDARLLIAGRPAGYLQEWPPPDEDNQPFVFLATNARSINLSSLAFYKQKTE